MHCFYVTYGSSCPRSPDPNQCQKQREISSAVSKTPAYANLTERKRPGWMLLVWVQKTDLQFWAVNKYKTICLAFILSTRDKEHNSRTSKQCTLQIILLLWCSNAQMEWGTAPVSRLCFVRLNGAVSAVSLAVGQPDCVSADGRVLCYTVYSAQTTQYDNRNLVPTLFWESFCWNTCHDSNTKELD